MKKETDPKREESIEDVLKRKSAAKACRTNFESTWQAVRDIFAPYHEGVITEETEGGELDFSKIWTDEPIEAVRVFVSGLQTYLTPMNTPWVSLRMRNKSMQESSAVKVFLEKVKDEVMYTLTNSNFEAAIAEAFTQSVVYGTTTMTIDADEQDRVRYNTVPINSVLIVDDSRGKVGEYFVTSMLTAEQAIDKFGDSVHSEIKRMAHEMNNTKFEFVYHVRQRKIRDKRKKDKLNMPIETAWIDVTNKHYCERGGFQEMPIATHRFYKRSTTPYGYSPCMLSIASSRTLNKMASTNLRGGMKFVDAAIAVPSRGFLTKLNTNPNAVNIYQKDVNKDSVFTLPGGAGVPFGIEYEQRLSERMKRMLYNHVFNALSGVTKEMTVPEVQQRVQEAMTQIGPAIGRFQAEFLDVIIIRTIGLLARGGFLPQPPQEMFADSAYEIEYTSYLARMQKNGGGNAMMRFMQYVQFLAQFDAAVLDNFDADAAYKAGAEFEQIPASVSRDTTQVQAIREGRLEAEQGQMQLTGIEQGARAAKDIGSAAGAMGAM